MSAVVGPVRTPAMTRLISAVVYPVAASTDELTMTPPKNHIRVSKAM
jgi:hypothetical protein